MLGLERLDALTSVGNLALVLQEQGKYEVADEMNLRVLAGYEKVLGVEYPFTLASVSNLASLLQDQGKYEAAEEMNRRALAGMRRRWAWSILENHCQYPKENLGMSVPAHRL